jgi:DNA-binding NtrC family response regulator
VDLVLTDMVMPGTSGTALAERVAELRPHAAVAFMTGYSDRRDAVGGADVLAKPFTAEQLLRAVAVALGRRGRHGRPRPLGAT